MAARAPPPRARHRAAAGAHRLHAVRRFADPGLRAALHQVPRALERARHRQRGQSGRQGGARPRAARDRRRAGGGAMRLGRVHPGATPPASAPPLLCRWDLDKTYLRSEFDSLRSLLRTAFERAEDKVDVPGVAELIRTLKAAAERRGRSALVYFVSASPPQIGAAIRKKLALDGVPYDGIVFKDQLAYLKRGKLRNLREHVGFKLAALLRGRLAAPPGAAELLFGDDWELDSLIYSLYPDLVAGRLLPARPAPILRQMRVDTPLVDDILTLAGPAAGAERSARSAACGPGGGRGPARRARRPRSITTRSWTGPRRRAGGAHEAGGLRRGAGDGRRCRGGRAHRAHAGRGAARGLRQRGGPDPLRLPLAGRGGGDGGASAAREGARRRPARAGGARARAAQLPAAGGRGPARHRRVGPVSCMARRVDSPRRLKAPAARPPP